MRRQFIETDQLVLCRSDRGDGGWSLHAPGSTDDEIATGDAPYLVSGGDGEPTEADYLAAAEKLAPWACEVIPCEGGFQAFESTADADTWRAQV